MTQNCGFEVKGMFAHQTISSLGDKFYKFSLMAVCNRCRKAIVTDTDYLRENIAQHLDEAYSEKEWTALEMLYRQYNLTPLVFYPQIPKPDIPTGLSNEVEQKIRSAEKLYLQAKGDSDMLEFAGNSYRKTLEVALKELDVDDMDKNLNWRINSLVSSGILVKPMGDFAHRIRLLGNNATHDEITLAELEQLRLFTQLFLQYAFTLPSMIPDDVKIAV